MPLTTVFFVSSSEFVSRFLGEIASDGARRRFACFLDHPTSVFATTTLYASFTAPFNAYQLNFILFSVFTPDGSCEVEVEGCKSSIFG